MLYCSLQNNPPTLRIAHISISKKIHTPVATLLKARLCAVSESVCVSVFRSDCLIFIAWKCLSSELKKIVRLAAPPCDTSCPATSKYTIPRCNATTESPGQATDEAESQFVNRIRDKNRQWTVFTLSRVEGTTFFFWPYA